MAHQSTACECIKFRISTYDSAPSRSNAWPYTDANLVQPQAGQVFGFKPPWLIPCNALRNALEGIYAFWPQASR